MESRPICIINPFWWALIYADSSARMFFILHAADSVGCGAWRLINQGGSTVSESGGGGPVTTRAAESKRQLHANSTAAEFIIQARG